MKAIWTAAAATLFLCGAAWAQDLPRYEIEADCRDMYKGDPSGYDHCIDHGLVRRKLEEMSEAVARYARI